MRWRRNPYDAEKRKIERVIESGELGPVQGGDMLDALDMRYDRLSYDSAVALAVVRRGPIYGWSLVWEHPGVIVLTPESYYVPWGLVLLTTPWPEDGKSTSPLAVAYEDSWAEQVSLRDLNTPRTGNVVRDAHHYRDELARAISFMSAAAAARHIGLCVCSTFPDPTCPTHGSSLAP